MDITTTRDKEKGTGYISYWHHDGCQGKARSSISPEQAEKNAIRQANNAGCRMIDYNGQPQAPSIRGIDVDEKAELRAEIVLLKAEKLALEHRIKELESNPPISSKNRRYQKLMKEMAGNGT